MFRAHREGLSTRGPILFDSAVTLALMAATVEELYRNYGILADAKEDLSQVGTSQRTLD